MLTGGEIGRRGTSIPTISLKMYVIDPRPTVNCQRPAGAPLIAGTARPTRRPSVRVNSVDVHSV